MKKSVKIKLVKTLTSQPTQTDLEEILSLEPILPTKIAEGSATFSMKSPEPSNDADSSISSCSKSEDYMHKPVSAGLDMRRGEYKELEFPPVSTSSQLCPKFALPVKERSPSPMDLCVTAKTSTPITETASTKPKSVTHTITMHPFADIPKVKMSSIVEKKLTPAHQPHLKLMSDSKHIFGPTAIMSGTSAFIGHTVRSVGRPSRVTDLSVKPMSSLGQTVTSGHKIKKPKKDVKPFGGKEVMQLPSFADVHKRSVSPEAESSVLHCKRHVSTSDVPSKDLMETDVRPTLTPKLEVPLSQYSSLGEGKPFISKVNAADYISVEEPFTPRRIIGLKLGSKISQGAYSKRRLGIGQGHFNQFSLLKTSEHATLTTNLGIPRIQEKNCSSKVEIKQASKLCGKRSHEVLDNEDTDDTPKNKKTIVVDATPKKEDMKKLKLEEKEKNAIEEGMKLPETLDNDDGSTLSFSQLQNAQNTSSDSVANSQLDDSKDSTYVPSKSTATTSTSEPTNEESADEGDNADHYSDGAGEEDIPSENDVTQEADISVESKISNPQGGDADNAEGEQIIMIKVPSAAILSPKSRQRRIKEYSQIIG